MLITGIKVLHSLIVLYLVACLWMLWQYAQYGLFRRWLLLCIGSLLAEIIVYTAHGFRCPLTTWALALGDDTGGDWLSEWLFVAPVNWTPAFGGAFLLGMIGVIRRWRYETI